MNLGEEEPGYFWEEVGLEPEGGQPRVVEGTQAQSQTEAVPATAHVRETQGAVGCGKSTGGAGVSKARSPSSTSPLPAPFITTSF